MPQTLTAPATERSSYPIEVTFRDGGAGAAVTPTSATWSLVDAAGSIINGRDDVPLSTPGGVGIIVLQGADLAVPESVAVKRRVLVRAVYDSVAYGDDLPLTEEFEIVVQPLAGIPPSGP